MAANGMSGREKQRDVVLMKTPLNYQRIRESFDRQPLFEDKTWQLSPEPWPLLREQVEEIERIGDACFEFHRALETLYIRSADDRKLLRNRDFKAPWASSYFDRGKPLELVGHSRSKRTRGLAPPVIRPDLLVTEDGFALTEIDTVPGGIGLTAFLNRLYASEDYELVGEEDAMIHGFYKSLVSTLPNNGLPLIGIIVSDESQTYRPEMEWLAKSLQEMGKRVYCLHPNDLMPLGNTVCASIDGNPEQVDILYRFWELFDLANVSVARYLLDALEESELVVTPPMRHFQEEKLSLALFHHHLLEEFWSENLSPTALKILRKIIPKSWIMDQVELPPNAVLDAPYIGGKPIWRWEQLGEASQKERNFIIKMSGFHEMAWGARSVVLGSDSPRREWSEKIEKALDQSDTNLHILQDYHKPKRLDHPVYRDTEDLFLQEGRVRLNPFFFVWDGRAHLCGILNTFCPADKKIIHGMKDAALLPCRYD